LRRKVAHVFSVALCLLPLSLHSAAALAQEEERCTSQPRGFIAASTPAAPSSSLPWEDVVEHVRSELQLRGLGLCTTPAPGSPLARLAFDGSADQRVHIALLAGDTGEPVAQRSLDLQSVPSDARQLAIAVATDELLASSLAELEQRRAKQAPRPEPRPSAPPAPPPAAKAPRFELGPGFVYEAYGGGLALLGVDLRGAVRVTGPLSATLRVGYRQGLPEPAPHGSLRASALLAGLGLRLRFVEGERFQLFLLGRTDALRLSADAYADAGATARAQTDVAIVASVGPGLALALSDHLRIGFDVTAGGALRPVHVTDTGERVSGVSGLSLAAGGGVSVLF
jgi:hypothetical protein